MIRTAIVEDDPIMLERLERVISQADDIAISATASDAASGRRLIAEGGFDVLLCDLGLPDGDGIELIRDAATRYPEADIMVVTIFADQKKVLNSIRAGARGYILKDQRLEDCVQAIREVRAGGSPISPIIARQLLQRLQPERAAPQDEVALTDREAQVLRILSRGFSIPECADMLAISPFTVGTHVKNLYRKLEVSSRAEAVFEATSRGILDAN
jgi:DNA-binding NarL/FixJ family response regulator